MKRIKIIGTLLILSIGSYGQSLNIEGSSNQLSNVNLTINKPLFCDPLGIDIGHKDNLSLPKKKEKQKSISSTSNYARSLRFTIKFKSNCEYDVGNDNQRDWNKVMAIHQTNASDDLFNGYNNMRIGWRWNLTTQMMDVGFYAHIQHEGNDNPGREFFFIKGVNLETNYNAELILGNGGCGIIMDDVGAFIKRRDLFGETTVKTAFYKSAYFGGQECPPHRVKIRVTGIKGDNSKTNWYNGACNKIFARSIFYNGENLVINAAETFIFSEQAYRGQYRLSSSLQINNQIPAGYSDGDEIPWFEQDGERYVKIESGSSLTCNAGQMIKLLPGFHAENGSYFRANMDASITCATFVKSMDTGYINDEISFEEVIIEDEEAYNVLNRNDADNNIYPNPSNGLYNVSVSDNFMNGEFKVYDLLGKIVLSGKINNRVFGVDLSGKERGVYTILFSGNNNGKIYTQKIILQ